MDIRIWTALRTAYPQGVRPIPFEKTIPTASFEELWRGRRPDFRARNERRNLKRRGIEAEFVNQDENSVTVRALAETIPHIRYLADRGYEKVPQKARTKPFSDVVQAILARPRTGPGGGIPLSRGEVAMLFLDGYAGDHPNLLDIRS